PLPQASARSPEAWGSISDQLCLFITPGKRNQRNAPHRHAADRHPTLTCPRRWITPTRIALGHLEIMSADGPGSLQLLGSDLTHHFAGHPHDDGARRDTP